MKAGKPFVWGGREPQWEMRQMFKPNFTIGTRKRQKRKLESKTEC